MPFDQTEADIARQPQHVGLIGKQPVQAVGGDAHGHGVEAPPALIALEHIGAPVSRPSRAASAIASAKRRDIAQAHVEALPGDRMNDMRGVANQRDALGDEARAP